MRPVALTALTALACLACVSPADPDPAQAVEAAAPRPRPPGLAVAGLLDKGGVVAVGEARFDLSVAPRAAELGRLLARREGTVVLEAERGVPLVHVERLLTLLAATGIEDYRLDLGR